MKKVAISVQYGQEMLSKEAKRTISEVWLPGAVNGLGTEARYHDGDEVAMFSAGDEGIVVINQLRTTDSI
jgi:hypothetical protein